MNWRHPIVLRESDNELICTVYSRKTPRECFANAVNQPINKGDSDFATTSCSQRPRAARVACEQVSKMSFAITALRTLEFSVSGFHFFARVPLLALHRVRAGKNLLG